MTASVARFIESFIPENYNLFLDINRSEKTFTGNVAITGEALIEDISGVKDIPNSHGNYGLRMPMNTQVAFEHFTLTNHQDIKISIRKGGILLVEGEGMRARTYRKGETSYPSLVPTIGEWHQSFQNHRYKKQSSGLRSYRPHTGRQYQKRLLLCRQRLRTRHDSYLFPIYRKQRLEP